MPLLLWEFSTELFDGGTGERMLGQFLRLLESSVRKPEDRVGNLSMLDDKEHHQVLEFDARARHAFGMRKSSFIVSLRLLRLPLLINARLSMAKPHLAIFS